MKKKILLKMVGGICLTLLMTALHTAQSSASQKEIYRIEVRTSTFGGSSYILSFAITDILNKKSTWVRGSVMETPGTPDRIIAVGRDPKKRKRTIFTCAYEDFAKAKAGKPPFDDTPEKYKDLMMIVSEQKLAAPFITLDPNIKTYADLKGKRVGTWPRGTVKFDITHSMIGGAGKEVLDSIKWQYTQYQAYDDMVLGKCDAAFAFCPERGSGKYSTVPKLKELMTKRKVYFVTATPEMRDRSKELFGEAYGYSFKVPANGIAEGFPAQDTICYAILLGYAVYPDMPEDVVYEIVKKIDENHSMVKDYHKAGATWGPKTYGTYPADKKYWHPGARRYYDEKGIEYGTDYFFKAYPLK